MQALNILIANSPEEAPHYARDTPDVRAASIHTTVVVARGTEAGLPTVDFQITTNDGAQFVAMLTGTLVEQLAEVVAGVRLRAQG